MAIHFVTDPTDERLVDYRDLRDGARREEAGTFIAESEVVVRRLLAGPMRGSVTSLLLTAPRLATLESMLPTDVPVFVVPQEVMDGVAGLSIHRGCLATGRRPVPTDVPPAARRFLALEDLVDVDNVGAAIRNAAAFGVDAVLLSPRCADPFYRKAIRVSAGAVFEVPIVRLATWGRDLRALAASRQLPVVGAVVDPAALALPRLSAPEGFILMLGSEGPGLSAAGRAACQTLATIPMAPGVDSLNVAVASAVFLYQLCQAHGGGGSPAG